MSILNIVEKAKILIDDELEEDELNYAVKRCEKICLKYCGIEECEEDGFEDICAEMAVEFMENKNSGVIKSIKEGDISLSFSENNEAGFGFMNDYKQRLEPYRKIRWK